jgi:predicted transcriptional regulator
VTRPPALIQTINDTLARLSSGTENIAPHEGPKEPAVSIRKSITPEYLICLEDGKRFKSLKKHLAAHGLTPDQYRAKWTLPSNYPMVAPNYAAARSALAKAIGLGQGAGKARACKRGRPPKAM